ncbi:MAG: DUF6432 family protein [Halobacteriales archaeon]
MQAKRSYRDRDGVEVAVLDALLDRGEEGMTVLELRAAVDADIDALEEALSALKRDGLIEVEREDGSTIITPSDRVVPDPGEEPPEPSLFEWIRERLPF